MTLKAGDILRAGDRIATASNQEVQMVSEMGDRVLLREEGELNLGTGNDDMNSAGSGDPAYKSSNVGRVTSRGVVPSNALRLAKGAIVAQVKRPTSFATPHAGVETDGADFFLMVATGLTTNGAPWSFSRVDVTEGSAKFVPSSISNLRSEIPLVAGQTVCAGTDMEGQTIAVKAGKSDCRELSPKYGGVFFREYAELYETKGAALDVLRFTEGRVLLETNAWQMMDKLTSQGGPKIAKDTRRRTGEPALRIANGTADVARVSFPLGLPSVDAFQVTVQHSPVSRSGPNGHYFFGPVSMRWIPVEVIGQTVIGRHPDPQQSVDTSKWHLQKVGYLRVGAMTGGRSVYETSFGRCDWWYVKDPEKWGVTVHVEQMGTAIGAIRIQELRCARENTGAGGPRDSLSTE